MDNFARGLSVFVRRSGMSCAEIASRLACDRSNLSLWQSSKTTATIDKVANLLDAGMSLSEVFGEGLAKKILLREGINGPTDAEKAAIVRDGLRALLDSMQ